MLLLRHQLPILQRTQTRPARLTRWERIVLAVLAARLARLCGGAGSRWSDCLLLFRPDTLLRWHRDLVRRKWTSTRRPRRGRPRIDPDLEALVLRPAHENPGWGYGRIRRRLWGALSRRDLVSREARAKCHCRGPFLAHGSGWMRSEPPSSAVRWCSAIRNRGLPGTRNEWRIA